MFRSIFFISLVLCVFTFNTDGVTILECTCSPSTRGFRAGVLTELTQSRAALKKLSADYWEKAKNDNSITPGYVQQKISEKAVSLWSGCISNWNHEECVNADVQLRVCDGKCDRDSFCKFNGNTWKNILDGHEVPGCDESPLSSSTNSQIVNGIPEFKTPVKPSNSPTPSPSRNVALPIPSRKPATTPAPEASVAPSTAVPGGNASEPVSIGPGFAGQLEPSPDASISSTEPTAISASVNEGCVAIEHLEGYVLQHPKHLVRQVLCAHGFCATPNHAIIVDGAWTSMKRLCSSQWQCTRSVKLVNNIKAKVNSRVRVNERIVVTPYDLRFPRWGVWLVQFLEDSINLCGLSCLVCGVTTFAVFMSARFGRVSL